MIEQYLGLGYLLFLQYIRQITGGIFDSFFVMASALATSTAVLMIMAIVYWSLDKKLGEYLLVSFGFGRLVNSFMKITACIYRPWILDSRIKPLPEVIEGASGYSFPSGHATSATVTFAGPVLRGKTGKALGVILIAWLIIVLFSRNYVGVHSPVDVIVGLISTLAVLWITGKLFDRLEENPNFDLVIAGVGIAASVILIIYAAFKSYPMDYTAAGKLLVDPAKMALDAYKDAATAIGILIFWLIERRFINFSTEMSLEHKMAVIFGGFIGFQILSMVLSEILESAMGDVAGGILIHIIYGAYIILIVPAIIKYFQNKNEQISD